MDENRPNGPEGQPPPQTAVNTTEPATPCRTSGLAIASLASFILGLLGMLECVIIFSLESEQSYGYAKFLCSMGIDPSGAFTYMFGLSVLGLALGLIGQTQIGRNPTRLKGHSMAHAGVIMGIIMVIIIFLLPIFTLRGFGSPKTSCLNNLKQIGTAIAMYSTDWDDKFPRVSGPGREFERVYGWTYNYRTKSTTGERRWLQNVVAPYAKNKKIFMCPTAREDGTWTIPGKGTVRFLYNRHGGAFSPADPERIDPPIGSSDAGLEIENDPPTSYWFNTYVTKSGQPDKVISGRSEEICDKTADAPIVWDTPCGFDDGSGDAQIAHEDVINVCYADGHAKPYQIPNPREKEWLDGDFRVLHGSDGWYPEK